MSIDKEKVQEEVKNGTFTQFRKLLRKGIGTRNQLQFAKEAGLSRGTINRMLNAESISQPTMQTIEKLSAHMPEISEGDLLESCGYQRRNAQSVILSVRKSILAGLDSFKGTLNSSVKDDLLSMIYMLYSDQTWEWEKEKEGKIEKKESLPGENFETWAAVYNVDGCLCKTYFTLGLAYTTQGNVVLVSYLADISKMAENQFISSSLCGSEAYAGSGTVVWKTGDDSRKTAQERLLESIFGSSGRDVYIDMWYGCGFSYTETPEGFESFLMNHAGLFCTSPDNTMLYQRLIQTGDSPDKIFKDYENEDGVCGTGAVVADIMTRLLGDSKESFLYLKKELDDSTDDSCIILPADNDMDELDGKTLRITYETASELGIKKFGMTYFRHLVHKKTRQIYNTDEFHYHFTESAASYRDPEKMAQLAKQAENLCDFLWDKLYPKEDTEENKYEKNESCDEKSKEDRHRWMRDMNRLAIIRRAARTASEGKEGRVVTQDMIDFVKEKEKEYFG